MPTGTPTPPETRAMIRRLAEEGKSTREIARAVGMKQRAVWKLGKYKLGVVFHGKHGGHNRKTAP